MSAYLQVTFPWFGAFLFFEFRQILAWLAAVLVCTLLPTMGVEQRALETERNARMHSPRRSRARSVIAEVQIERKKRHTYYFQFLLALYVDMIERLWTCELKMRYLVSM